MVEFVIADTIQSIIFSVSVDARSIITVKLKEDSPIRDEASRF